MQVGEDEDWIVIKLDRGEAVLPSLQGALAKLGVTSGLVLSGIGALEDLELGWFGPGERDYTRHRFEGSHELLSLQGTVTLDADPPLHLHASLAARDNRAVGGHLFEGRVAVLAEIGVRRLSGLRLTRQANPATGLNELVIRSE